MKHLQGISFFTQTIGQLVLALIVSQVVSLGMILSLPPPRPNIISVSELADALKRGAVAPEDQHALQLLASDAQPPQPTDQLSERPDVNALLAAQLGATTDNVHLYFEHMVDQLFVHHLDQIGPNNPEEQRADDPIFFDAVQADWFRGGRWVSIASKPWPFINEWQRAVMLWFLLTTLALLPLGWFFARQVTRPIRGFASAVEAVGRNERNDTVPEEGPRELRLAAQALNRMQARIDAYLGERTAMIGAIAHDLRTPLSRIAFRIEATPPIIRDKVQDDIAQMQEMIADTLAFVRGATTQLRTEVVELGGLLAEVSKKFVETGNSVHYSAPFAPIIVAGDQIALERLFTNLISNAIKFGTRADVTLIVDVDVATIIIIDNGLGMPSELLTRAFDPFERGDPSRNPDTGGVGLGLAIARTIIAGHSGTLILANRAEGGLKATITLPTH